MLCLQPQAVFSKPEKEGRGRLLQADHRFRTEVGPGETASPSGKSAVQWEKSLGDTTNLGLLGIPVLLRALGRLRGFRRLQASHRP
jgi:hypothetical protein